MLRYLIILISFSVLMPAQASRLALVIGNGNYNPSFNQLRLGTLENPSNDATDIAKVLQKLGFEVILRTNATRKTMRRAMHDFSQRLEQQHGGVGLFYFSGHGFQYNNINYLLPLRADIQRSVDIDSESFRADDMLSSMEDTNRHGVNLVIMDACRESIPANFFREGKGLSKGGFTNMQAPIGSLIAYSTAPNTTSWGGLPTERNSVYTKHLLKALQNKPDLNITYLLMSVRKNVIQETQDAEVQQVPWDSVSLTKPFCFTQCLSEQEEQLRLQVAELKRQQAELEKQRQQAKLERKRQPDQTFEVLETSKVFDAQIAGTVFRDRLKNGSFGPEMVVIPTGRFQMGGRYSQKYHHLTTEIPVHWVDIRYEFAMGKYEVTNAEFVQFLNVIKRRGSKEKPWFETEREDYNSHIKGSVNNFYVESNYEMHPVIEVSWYGAVAYAKWMSKQTGEEYRLPSEAEWEYAARAGTETRYWWGNDAGENKANCRNLYCNHSFKYTAPVGSFNANQFGLYDTVGNVWEWVADGWHEDYTNAPNDGRIWTVDADDSLRVQRGGSWLDSPYGSRMNNAARVQYTPNSRDSNVGFRVVRRVVARTN